VVKQRSNSGQTAVNKRSNSDQTAVKPRSNRGQRVVKQRSNRGQTAVKPYRQAASRAASFPRRPLLNCPPAHTPSRMKTNWNAPAIIIKVIKYSRYNIINNTINIQLIL
jgi:hypothetical protein